jgi:hypothetical protein
MIVGDTHQKAVSSALRNDGIRPCRSASSLVTGCDRRPSLSKWLGFTVRIVNAVAQEEDVLRNALLLAAESRALRTTPYEKKGGAEAPPSLGRKRPRKQQHDHGPPSLPSVT